MKNILVTRSSMPSLDEYVEEIRPIWDSHWMTNMGEKHKKLQAELEKYLGIPRVALYTNGHLALENVIAALNLPKGGEVITTPFTFASTTHAIVRNGLIYYFTRNSFLAGLSQNVLRLIDVIMCASLLFVISDSKGRVTQVLSKDYMVRLGQLTMFLFIFHYPARMIVTVMFDRISCLAEMGEIKYPIEVVCIIGITIALTYIAAYKGQHLKKLLPDNN